MTELAFVIWMVFYPFTCSISTSYRIQVMQKQYSDGVVAVSALIHLVIWVSIGVMLWSRVQ